MHDFENQRFLLLSLTGFMVSTTLPPSKYHITHQLWQLESFLPMSPMFCHKEVNCRHWHGDMGGVDKWADGVPIILVVIILCVPSISVYSLLCSQAHCSSIFSWAVIFPRNLYFLQKRNQVPKSDLENRKSPHFAAVIHEMHHFIKSFQRNFEEYWCMLTWEWWFCPAQQLWLIT